MPMGLRGLLGSDVSNDEGCSVLLPVLCLGLIQGSKSVGQDPQLRTSVLCCTAEV